MRNLILLFLKYGRFASFLFLEIVCFFLIVRFNQKQNEIYVHSANLVTGNIYEQYKNTIGFMKLGDVRDSLMAENAELRALLDYSKFDQRVKIDTAKSAFLEQQYQYIEARVINNSINRNNNFITLNKGKMHGVAPRMGVIGKTGILGIVKDVSQHFSTVMSPLHRQFRLSASLKKTGHFGTLTWQEQDPRVMQLTQVPKIAEVEVGDTVVTSGFSTHFPAGLMIGTINDFTIEKGSSFLTIQVKLINDLNAAQFGYVVKNLFREEREKLEEEANK